MSDSEKGAFGGPSEDKFVPAGSEGELMKQLMALTKAVESLTLTVTNLQSKVDRQEACSHCRSDSKGGKGEKPAADAKASKPVKKSDGFWKPDSSSDSSSPERAVPGASGKGTGTVPKKPQRGNLSTEEDRDEEVARFARVFHKPREAPKPEIFSLESGRSLRAFLRQFEGYCRSKYGSATEDDWTAELGRLLSGEIRGVFDAFGGTERPFPAMALKLKEYCSRQGERIAAERHHSFQQAQRLSGESLRLFALRLERLFVKAYPRRDPETSAELSYKFLSSIPASDAKGLERDMHLVRKYSKATVTSWSDLVDLIQPDTYAGKVKSPPQSPSKTVWFGSGAKPKGHQGEKVAAAVPVTPPRQKGPRVTAGSPPPRQTPRTPPRTPPQTPPSSGLCGWCHKGGHRYEDCWRRLGLCLLCGSDQHFMMACPRTRSPSVTRQHPGTSPARSMTERRSRPLVQTSVATRHRSGQSQHSDSQASRGSRANRGQTTSASSTDSERERKKKDKRKKKKRAQKKKSGNGTSSGN